MKKTPFSVMCIKPDTRHAITKEPSPALLQVMNEYVVINVMTVTDAVGSFYVLSEIPGYCFAARLFATLPEQSADEVNEQEREAIIYQRL